MKRTTAPMGALVVALLALMAVAGAADAHVSSKVRGKLAGAKAPLSQLQQVSVRKGLKATFYRVRQEVDGLPVIDSEAVVADVPGRGQRLIDGTRGPVRRPAAATLSARKAGSIARGRVNAKRVIYGPRSSKAILVGAAGPRLVWRVVLGTRAPLGSFEVIVDARSGRVVRVRNQIHTASAQVSVFDPNPVVTASDPSTLDPADNDAGADAEASDQSVTVADPATLGDPVCLEGPAVTVFDSVGDLVCETTGDFRTSRVDSGRRASANDYFESGMTYFHVGRTQSYLQHLGFDGTANTAVLAGGITANVNTSTDDNSYYDPGDISLNFGTGGVDDAEDAEVTVHEYGHAIQDDQVPG